MKLEPSITLRSPDKRQTITDALAKPRAIAQDLYWAMKTAHWNIRGMSFDSLHPRFDDLANLFAEAADTLAERSRILGALVAGNAQSVVALSGLPPFPEDVTDDVKLLSETAVRLAAFRWYAVAARAVAAKLDDQQTFDEITKILDDVEKKGWFVLAHLAPAEAEAAVATAAKLVGKGEAAAAG